MSTVTNNTLVYSEKLQAYDYFCDLSPISYIYVSGNTYAINQSGDIININGGYDSKYEDYIVRIVVNDEAHVTKVFDSADLFFTNNNKNTVIKTSFFSTSNDVSNIAGSDSVDEREGTKRISIPRSSKSSVGERIRDKYLICNYNITPGSTAPYYFSLPYIKTHYRYSFI